MDIILLAVGIILLLLKKTALSITIMFALLTSYFQLGSNMSETIIVHNVSDCGLILFFIIWWFNSRRNKPITTQVFFKLKRVIIIFVLFLMAAMLYDMMFRGTGVASELRTYRHWLLMIFAIPFASCSSLLDLKKAIKYIFYLSIAATIIILLSHFLNIGLVNSESSYISNEGANYERGAIPTTYCIFYLFLILSSYYRVSNIAKYLICGLFLLSIITSLIRSMFVASLLGVLMMLFSLGKVKLKTLIGYAVILILFFEFFAQSNGFAGRLLEGFGELKSLASNGISTQDGGSLIFRLSLLVERATYVASSVDKFIFGIGGITEEEFQPIFMIGLNGAQLDTADIAWPLLLLRLGYVGTFIFALIWFFYAKFLYKANSVLGVTGYVYLIIKILLSFCSADIANGSFWLFMVIILYVAYFSPNAQESPNIS